MSESLVFPIFFDLLEHIFVILDFMSVSFMFWDYDAIISSMLIFFSL